MSENNITPVSKEYHKLHIKYIKELNIINNNLKYEIFNAIMHLGNEEEFFSSMKTYFQNAVELLNDMNTEGLKMRGIINVDQNNTD